MADLLCYDVMSYELSLNTMLYAVDMYECFPVRHDIDVN